jgi:hypothetical protein
MISKRIVILTAVIAAILLAGVIAETLLFDTPPIKIEEDVAGPLKVMSPNLQLPGRREALPVQWTERGAALLYNWKNAETQELLGPIRVVVLWSNKPEREWLRAGSVCDFLFREFGEEDHLTSVPGFDALSLQTKGITAHTCMANSLTDGRQAFYTYDMPEGRCGWSALIFWKVPWSVNSDTADAVAFNARLDGGLRARALNAARASIAPDATCQRTVSSISRNVITAGGAGFASILLLLIVIYRRSA